MPIMDNLVEELSQKLGDQPFYTLRELTRIRFFGSMTAARLALKKGYLPFISISPRRKVIPRQALVEYLKNNYFSSEWKEEDEA